MINETSADKNSYKIIWEKIISQTIKNYEKKYKGLKSIEKAEEVIWENYNYFNSHCKKNYMINSSGKLDRHKVCASYMYAIIKSHIWECPFEELSEKKIFCLNESLAITTGISLLRAFILTAIEKNENFSEKKKRKYISKIEKGFAFPPCNHGYYQENFTVELYFSNKEENYNLLSLANTLYLLEVYNLQIGAINKIDKKKK